MPLAEKEMKLLKFWQEIPNINKNRLKERQ